MDLLRSNLTSYSLYTEVLELGNEGESLFQSFCTRSFAFFRLSTDILLQCREYIVEKLEVGKWIFLWVVLGEAISLGLALVMKLMGKLEGKYENMDLEQANRLHNLELQGISHSMTSQQSVTNKNEDR